MTKRIEKLSDPRMHIRSAYGTRASALREYMDCRDREDPVRTVRAYHDLVAACADAAEADLLIALARGVMYSADGVYNMHDAREALDRALGL